MVVHQPIFNDGRNDGRVIHSRAFEGLHGRLAV